jgi:hypothetical protein
MPKFELTYERKGKCEGIRLALKLGGHQFTEKTIDKEEFENKGGNGCITKIDGKTFYQGPAVLRLIGAITKVDGKELYSNDPITALEIDNAIENIRDLRNKSSPLLAKKGDEKAISDLGKVFSEYMKRLEDTVEATGGPYLCGKYLSIADLELVALLNWIAGGSGSSELLKQYPKMKSLHSLYKKNKALQ